MQVYTPTSLKKTISGQNISVQTLQMMDALNNSSAHHVPNMQPEAFLCPWAQTTPYGAATIPYLISDEDTLQNVIEMRQANNWTLKLILYIF